jgi:hypothetical protein
MFLFAVATVGRLDVGAGVMGVDAMVALTRDRTARR